MSYKRIVVWNTGRLYTRFGQRVAAGLRDDGLVDINDVDRQIFVTTQYKYPLPNPKDEFDDDMLEAFAMGAYDRLEYSMGRPSKELMEAAHACPAQSV
jgi:hypothetical protein